MRYLLLTVLLLASGCLGPLHRSRAHDAAVRAMPCRDVVVSPEDSLGWNAVGCGKTWSCRYLSRTGKMFCAEKWEGMPLKDMPDPPHEFLFFSNLASATTGCPPGDAIVTRPSDDVIRVANCDRELECPEDASVVNGVVVEPTCVETPESIERTAQKIAADRLALETGCPPGEVHLVEAAKWTRGTERAYRFNACGKPFVCTTAAGRTDCKAALAQEAPVAPTPPVAPAPAAQPTQ